MTSVVEAIFYTTKYALSIDIDKYMEDNPTHIFNIVKVYPELKYISYQNPTKIIGDGYEDYVCEYDSFDFKIVKPTIIKVYKNEISSTGKVKMVVKVELCMRNKDLNFLKNYNKDCGIECYITLYHKWNNKKYLLSCKLRDSEPSKLNFGNQ